MTKGKKDKRENKLVSCVPPVDFNGGMGDWQRAMEIHAPGVDWAGEVEKDVYDLILEEAEA